MFEPLEQAYRVVRMNLGGETEETIPLGSWRKGDGLAGSKGHVYEYGPGWAGVWINCRNPKAKMAELGQHSPNIVAMQAASGEGTFRVPLSDLPSLLPHLGAKRRFRASEAQLVAAMKGQAASPIGKRFAGTRRQKAFGEPESTTEPRTRFATGASE